MKTGGGLSWLAKPSWIRCEDADRPLLICSLCSGLINPFQMESKESSREGIVPSPFSNKLAGLVFLYHDISFPEAVRLLVRLPLRQTSVLEFHLHALLSRWKRKSSILPYGHVSLVLAAIIPSSLGAIT